jgi:hypothetical protein
MAQIGLSYSYDGVASAGYVTIANLKRRMAKVAVAPYLEIENLDAETGGSGGFFTMVGSDISGR